MAGDPDVLLQGVNLAGLAAFDGANVGLSDPVEVDRLDAWEEVAVLREAFGEDRGADGVDALGGDLDGGCAHERFHRAVGHCSSAAGGDGVTTQHARDQCEGASLGDPGGALPYQFDLGLHLSPESGLVVLRGHLDDRFVGNVAGSTDNGIDVPGPVVHLGGLSGVSDVVSEVAAGASDGEHLVVALDQVVVDGVAEGACGPDQKDLHVDDARPVRVPREMLVVVHLCSAVMNVELRHLRALAAIGDVGTITGAASALHVGQPALSRTLDQLESRLGTRLVERTTRRLVLTDAGQRLWEHAHRILNQLESALEEAHAGPRPLRVGFAWAALGGFTVPLLRGWRDDHPGMPVEVRRRDDPEATLRRGEIDVAFLRTQPPVGAALRTQALYVERRLAAVPDNDPLAGLTSVRLSDLAGRPVALCATAATTGPDLWPHGQQPQTFEVANVDEWLTAIATGDAVGVTAESTGHSHPYPGIRYLPISDAEPLTVYLVAPRIPTHSATEAFREHVLHTVGALQD